MTGRRQESQRYGMFKSGLPDRALQVPRMLTTAVLGTLEKSGGTLEHCFCVLIGEKSSNPTLRNVRTLLNILDRFLPSLWPKESRNLRLSFLGVLFCIAAERGLNVFVPLQLGLTMDKLQDSSLGPPWREISCYLLGRIAASRLGVVAAQQYLWSELETNGLVELTTAAYSHHMFLSKDYHESASSQDIVQVVLNGRNIIVLLRVVCFDLLPLLVDLAIGAEYLSQVIDRSLAGIVVTTMVSSLLLSWRASDWSASLQRKFIAAMNEEHRILADTSSNWATVAYFDEFGLETQRYGSAVKLAQSSVANYLLANTLIQGLKHFVAMSGLGTACYFAAHSIKAGDRTPGEFAMLIVYWSQLMAPLEAASAAYTQLLRSVVDAEKLVELFNIKPSIVERVGAPDLQLQSGKVSFTGVHFWRDGPKHVLDDINVTIPGGATVGIVGTSGG